MTLRSTLVLLLATGSCLATASPGLPARQAGDTVAPVRGQRSYEIYAAVLGDAQFNGRRTAAVGGALVVVRETVSPQALWWWSAARPDGVRYPDSIPGILPEATQEVLAAFLRANDAIMRIESRLPAGAGARLLDESRVSSWFRPGLDGWKTLYETIPGATGLIRFSAVGFDAGATRALVYVERTWNTAAGAGYLVTLHVDAVRWRITGVRQVWTS